MRDSAGMLQFPLVINKVLYLKILSPITNIGLRRVSVYRRNNFLHIISMYIWTCEKKCEPII